MISAVPLTVTFAINKSVASDKDIFYAVALAKHNAVLEPQPPTPIVIINNKQRLVCRTIGRCRVAFVARCPQASNHLLPAKPPRPPIGPAKQWRNPQTSYVPVSLSLASDIGAAAYHTMLRRIVEPDMSPMNVQLSGELIVRASSGTRLAAKPATKTPV